MVLILIGLSTAIIIRTWLDSLIFKNQRAWLGKYHNNKYFGIIVRGALCHYCISHWIAGALAFSYWLWPEITIIVMYALSGIYLANILIILFIVITIKLPQLMDLHMMSYGRKVKE